MTSPVRSRYTRTTNWDEFYKNGLPKEVITIDDDTAEEPADGLKAVSYHSHIPTNPPKHPLSARATDHYYDGHPSGKRRRMSPVRDIDNGYNTSPSSVRGSHSTQYLPKPSSNNRYHDSLHNGPPPLPSPLQVSSTTNPSSKRPCAQQSISPPPAPPPSAISNPTAYATLLANNENHAVDSASSRRPLPVAINSTHARAYGSQHGSITSCPSPVYSVSHSSRVCVHTLPLPPPPPLHLKHANTLPDPVVGQKRKRAARQATLEDTKRKEAEAALAHYRPPPNPPLRSKDVYVPVVRDLSSSGNVETDDKDGHYIVTPGTLLTNRYRIVRVLGQGTFGKVVEAVDLHTKLRCAVKVIRAVQKYRDASRIELRVLATLASNDVSNSNRCIHLRDCFDFRNHICIVTDLFGQSVFDFLKGNGFVPFPGSHIQKFAHQLLTSVAFLHDLNLIHTDLKPENILLVDHAYQTFTYNRSIPSSSTTIDRTSRNRKVLLSPEIRLIDFGSATFDDEFHSSVVSTRHYRAPEIILELGWSYPCDMWSVACILVEFYTGDALFQTHDNLEHLAMMEPVCNGPVDPDLVRAALRPSRSSTSNQVAECVPFRLSFFRSVLTFSFQVFSVKFEAQLSQQRHLENVPPLCQFNEAASCKSCFNSPFFVFCLTSIPRLLVPSVCLLTSSRNSFPLPLLLIDSFLIC